MAVTRLLLVWLIGMSMAVGLLVGLAVISTVRGRLPYLRDVIACLVGAAIAGVIGFVAYGPVCPAGPSWVVPSPYGPPPPGWTGVPR